MAIFPEIQKRFGFGVMRLPIKEGEIDIDDFVTMVDTFISEGFNYFDTAHGYLDGKSELAIKEALTSRYPREAYVLANKLSEGFFSEQEDIRPLFEKQLEACGVDYFDFYLMHSQNANNYRKYKACKAYETALELKKEGKIRHFAISFHDKPEVLRQILTEYPEIEAVQLQFNYLDYDDPAIQSKACYDVCVEFDKPVIVMEPVKGGSLIKLPEAAQKVLDGLGGGSNASYALRFAASFPDVFMVLSGMGNIDMVNENIETMRDVKPLDEKEMEALEKVRAIYRNQDLISCTACRYCVPGCPKKINIPDLFACYNTKKRFEDWNAGMYYHIVSNGSGKAGDCIKCGKCEAVCPQHLPIRELLAQIHKEFEGA